MFAFSRVARAALLSRSSLRAAPLLARSSVRTAPLLTPSKARFSLPVYVFDIYSNEISTSSTLLNKYEGIVSCGQ